MSMTPLRPRETGDDALGMHAGICRRDFLNAAALATGGAVMSPLELLAASDDWTGYGGVGDYRFANGNTKAVMDAAHAIRDHTFKTLPRDAADTGEVYDLVVVGGGLTGLAAALFFERQGRAGQTCLVLDDHAIFGGEAKGNEFLVDGQRLMAHQGSAFFPVPHAGGFVAQFYDLIGVDRHRFEYQKWAGTAPEIPLSQTTYDMLGRQGPTYGFYFGARFGQRPGLWLIDPWGKQLQGAPISEETRAELLRAHEGPNRLPETEWRPAFEGDPISRRLDTITLEQHLIDKHGLRRETIRTFMSPVTGGGYGLGPDVLSGYCAYAPETQHPKDGDEEAGGQMFPGGNAGFARHIVKTLIPASIDGPRTLEGVCRGRVNLRALDRPGQRTRIRQGSTVVWVEHDGEPEKSRFVTVAYARGGRIHRLKARAVVLAGGSWTTKHIVRDLTAEHRAAYAGFYRSPCLMANVAVRNWRFLYDMGISGGRWFEGLGNYIEVRKLATFGPQSPTINPDSPVVLTVKVLYSYPGEPIEAQGARGRMEMLSTSFRDYERRIREQFKEMFARSRFDARRDIAGIILNRWGHAYVNPQPGFFFGTGGRPAPREVLRRAPFGRMAFANTDLVGAMDQRNCFLEAQRAVKQILEGELTG
jgi:spermidine dehydrogenase